MHPVASSESFWIVAGTAAPIIALANVVVLGPAAAKRPFRIIGPPGITIVPRGIPFRRNWNALVVATTSTANLTGQALVLLAALVTLNYGNDTAPASLWVMVIVLFSEVYGLLLLAGLTVLSATARNWQDLPEKKTEIHRRPRRRAVPPARVARPSWQRRRGAPGRAGP
jgi:hypothetical protein